MNVACFILQIKCLVFKVHLQRGSKEFHYMAKYGETSSAVHFINITVLKTYWNWYIYFCILLLLYILFYILLTVVVEFRLQILYEFFILFICKIYFALLKCKVLLLHSENLGKCYIISSGLMILSSYLWITRVYFLVFIMDVIMNMSSFFYEINVVLLQMWR